MPSHMGVDVDRLAYRLHRPIAYGCQIRAHGPLTDAALHYLIAKIPPWAPLPEWARTLWLSDKGVESLLRCCLVQSPLVG
jgi:hypothetical protein